MLNRLFQEIVGTCYLLAIGAAADSATILAFFPMSSQSHHFVFRAIIEALAQRGHRVLYATPLPYKQPPVGISQMVLPFYSYDIPYDDVLNIGIYTRIKRMYMFGTALADQILGGKEVQELIHSDQKFDAVLFETYFAQEYLSAFIHKFDAIGIDVITLGDFSWVGELAGLPDNPAYQSDYKSDVVGTDFWDRLYNGYLTAITTLANHYFLGSRQQKTMDRYFNYTGWETRPSIDVLARNRSLILANFDYLFGYPYPAPPHRKDIGGINIKANNPLTKDLKTFMDGAVAGVIYMSLGSHVRVANLLKELDIFLDVFKRLPQRVLLKSEAEHPAVPANVRISAWFPQQDVLAHKNCALFITHGGQLSLSEAIYHGVPVIGVPFFADQPKNIIFAESQGFGRRLKISNISHETVSWTIQEVISNSRYKEEAVRRSTIFKDRRHTPAEEAVYWIEHSLKYPFALTPKSANLSAIQLHMIDVKLFIISIILILMYCFFLIISLIRKNNFNTSQVRNKSKVKQY